MNDHSGLGGPGSFCEYCGARVPAGGSYCAGCGRPVELADAAVPTAVQAAVPAAVPAAVGSDAEAISSYDSPAAPHAARFRTAATDWRGAGPADNPAPSYDQPADGSAPLSGVQATRWLFPAALIVLAVLAVMATLAPLLRYESFGYLITHRAESGWGLALVLPLALAVAVGVFVLFPMLGLAAPGGNDRRVQAGATAYGSKCKWIPVGGMSLAAFAGLCAWADSRAFTYFGYGGRLRTDALLILFALGFGIAIGAATSQAAGGAQWRTREANPWPAVVAAAVSIFAVAVVLYDLSDYFVAVAALVLIAMIVTAALPARDPDPAARRAAKQDRAAARAATYSVGGGYQPEGAAAFQSGHEHLSAGSAPRAPAGGYPHPYPSSTSGMAIASLVLGLSSCGGVLSIIFGHLARKEIRNSGGRKTGDGMALAGLILGYIHTAIWVVLLAVWIGLLIWGNSHPSHSYYDY